MLERDIDYILIIYFNDPHQPILINVIYNNLVIFVHHRHDAWLADVTDNFAYFVKFLCVPPILIQILSAMADWRHASND